MKLQQLTRFVIVTANVTQLAPFYERALGFTRMKHCADDDRGGAVRIRLTLGEQVVELTQFETPGRPYPANVVSSDLAFQHLAIIVSDMPGAYAQLRSVTGWTSISLDGPVQLPASSGGVTAFKFRDPEGHPLELLAFPTDEMPAYWKSRRSSGTFLGIDHSAISVADTARSVAFYESLGFAVSHRSINQGPEQAAMDNVDQPVVEVTAMSVDLSPPHVELLCYRHAGKRQPIQFKPNDIAATRMAFEADPRSTESGNAGAHLTRLVDPDGHHLSIMATGVIG